MGMGCESKVGIGTICVLLEFNQLTKSIRASQEKTINSYPDMIRTIPRNMTNLQKR